MAGPGGKDNREIGSFCEGPQVSKWCVRGPQNRECPWRMSTRHPSLLVLFVALGCLASPAFAAEKPPASSEAQIVVDADGITGTPAQALAISDDGKWLAAAAEKVVRIWNLHDNVLTFTLRGFQEPYGYRVGYINVLRFSPDSRCLAIGVTDNTEEGSTRIYDLANAAKFHMPVEGAFRLHAESPSPQWSPHRDVGLRRPNHRIRMARAKRLVHDSGPRGMGRSKGANARTHAGRLLRVSR